MSLRRQIVGVGCAYPTYTASVLVVIRLIDVLSQPNMPGRPTQVPARPLTGSGILERRKVRKPVEVFRRFLRLLADYRHAKMTPDGDGDIAERHAGIGGAVVMRTGDAFFQREAIKARRIEAMHGRPAIEAVADIRRRSFFARPLDPLR